MNTVLEYKESNIHAKLGGLPPQARVAFALACCQRVLSLCTRTGNRVNDGLAREVQNTMAQVWKELLLGQADAGKGGARLEEWLGFLESLPSDSDDDIEDIVAAIVYTLRCHQTGAVSECALLARRAYECADRIVVSGHCGPLTTASERAVLQHPLIQAELAAQEASLATLQEAHVSNRLPIVLRRLQSSLSC